LAVLIDSNVLVFSVQKGHPLHQQSIQAVELCLELHKAVFVFPQNIAEFWNVCTRPALKNGLGLSTVETERRLADLDPILTLVTENEAAYRVWRKWVIQFDIKGTQVHDARLAAGMIVHGIDRILTYNPRDFKRFGALKAVHPAEVAGLETLH
jgi:hypothetical protein